MTTNFKEFSAMVKELIIAANYVTPDEEFAIYNFITNLKLNYLKFATQLDGINTEVSLSNYSNPFGRNSIKKKHINEVNVYADKVGGKLEINVIVEFSFYPDNQDTYEEQFTTIIQRKIDETNIKNLKVDNFKINLEDNLMSARITFKNFE